MQRWLLALFFLSSLTAAAQGVEDIYVNGSVHTVNPQAPEVEAFAVANGKFVAVGSSDSMKRLAGKNTRVHDLEGRRVLPGFIDEHIHPDLAVEAYFNLNIDAENTDFEEFQKRLAFFLDQNPDKPWVLGSAIDYLWDDGSNIRMFDMPSHNAWLDELVSEKPVFLWEVSGHAALVNSKAFEVLGITKDTPDPEGGHFVRDEHGELTGVVRETAAHLFWEAFLGNEPPPEVIGRERLLPILQYLSSLGITSITDVWTRELMLQAYQALDREDQLPLHVSAYVGDPVEWINDWMKEAATRVIRNPEKYSSENVNVLGVKFVLDGGAAGQTAVMTTPFEGTDNTGPWRNDPDYFLKRVVELDRKGLTVRAHAAGDGAIRWALDAFERVRKEHGSTLRHGIAHTAILNPADIHRFSELGVIAEVSPIFWYHMPAVFVIQSDIGGRLNWLYPVRSLLDSGAPMSIGSDWIVTPASPWPALETLVTRRAPGVTEGPALNAAQGITLAEAVALYTIRGAYAQGREQLVGSIEPGKQADFIVIDQDIFNRPIHEVHKTTVLQTVVRGETVYDQAKAENVIDFYKPRYRR